MATSVMSSLPNTTNNPNANVHHHNGEHASVTHLHKRKRSDCQSTHSEISVSNLVHDDRPRKKLRTHHIEPNAQKRVSSWLLQEQAAIAKRPKNEYVHIERRYHPSKPVWDYRRPKVCVSHRISSSQSEVKIFTKKKPRVLCQSSVLDKTDISDLDDDDEIQTSEMDIDDERPQLPIRSRNIISNHNHNHNLATNQKLRLNGKTLLPTQKQPPSTTTTTTTTTTIQEFKPVAATKEFKAHSKNKKPVRTAAVAAAKQPSMSASLQPAEPDDDPPSALCTSFMNDAEFAGFSYDDRERLSRMKLALLYLKCCIAVLRPNSPTLPKQNEMHRWLDSKSHPPLTRIDIRLARKALKEEFDILLHSNSNKLTERFTSLHQAQEAMQNVYESAKMKCEQLRETNKSENTEMNSKNIAKRETNSDASSDCSMHTNQTHKACFTDSPTSPISHVARKHQG